MATLSGLSALYLVIPIFVYMGIGEDFYIYSSSQSLVNYISVLCFFALNIFILFLLKIAAKPPKFILFVKMSASTVIIYVNYVLMLLILVVGIKLRASGAGRPELLESISNPIVPGFGFILLLSCISCVLNKRKILT